MIFLKYDKYPVKIQSNPIKNVAKYKFMQFEINKIIVTKQLLPLLFLPKFSLSLYLCATAFQQTKSQECAMRGKRKNLNT